MPTPLQDTSHAGCLQRLQHHHLPDLGKSVYLPTLQEAASKDYTPLQETL